jgi:hypothetical protein
MAGDIERGGMRLEALKQPLHQPWRLMLAVNVAVMIGVFLYKTHSSPYVPYLHLLVDYHFGFTKRALIGALVGLFTTKVPVWLVFAIGGLIWLITLALFLRLFQKVFSFHDKQLPLLVCMVGSPFFFKNFLHSLGHFDIYGCAVAICLLLVPAHSILFVLLAALLAGVLILIHHIHILMYVPTIAVIVLVRHHLVEGAARGCIVVEALAATALAALFIAVQFWGTMQVPPEQFASYLQTKMENPSDLATLSFSFIWYQPLSKEISDTWARLPWNLWGIPAFALLIWLHAPLWRYFAESIRALRELWHRRIVIAALIAVTMGYLVMFAIIFDYSRWVANWAVCMFLILHAVKMLPVGRAVPPIPGDDEMTQKLGWIATVIPRVGVTRPF